MRQAIMICLATALCLAASSGFAADEAADAKAIEAIVRNYLEGWFTSDQARMEKALHPDLFKVTVRKTKADEAETLDAMEADDLIMLTGRNQDWVKDKKGIHSLKIVYQDEHFAVVHAVSTGFYDVCGLVKLNGEWKILQVLWAGNDITE
jgi:hypothetical protein